MERKLRGGEAWFYHDRHVVEKVYFLLYAQYRPYNGAHCNGIAPQGQTAHKAVER